eukprot:gi/632956138/ref/XP_007893810.1/ PREDICTED: uncharacterized protein LOC103180019 [Callorhinchus milii]
MERNEPGPEPERLGFVSGLETVAQLKLSTATDMTRDATRSKATETPCRWLGYPDPGTGTGTARDSSRCCTQTKVSVININKIPDSRTGFISRATNRSMGQPTYTCSNLGQRGRLPPSERHRLRANLTTATSLVVEAMKTKINHLVASPFKQSTASRLHHRCFSPGDELKLEILSETERMRKLMRDEKPPHCHPLVKGRLLKARLKPLYPVVDERPSIAQCRGILPEISNCKPNPRIYINTPYIDSAKELLMSLYQMTNLSLPDKKSQTTDPTQVS